MLNLATQHTGALPRARSVAQLEDELEILREENRQLRALITPTGYLPAAWGLTEAQRRVVVAIAQGRGHCVATERLNFAIAGFDEEAGHQSLKAPSAGSAWGRTGTASRSIHTGAGATRCRPMTAPASSQRSPEGGAEFRRTGE